MSMRIIRVSEANARFNQHAARIVRESEELSGFISDAISAVGVDTKNKWILAGAETCRVAYMDASEYLPETVAEVGKAFSDAGYMVNTMVMEGETDEDGNVTTITMMAFVWDPAVMEALRVLVVGEDAEVPAEEEEPAVVEEAEPEDEEDGEEADEEPVSAATPAVSAPEEEEVPAAEEPEEDPYGFPEDTLEDSDSASASGAY